MTSKENTTPITVAHGDGIGPEIMKSTLTILKAAGAALDIEEVKIGEKLYLDGNTSGISNNFWDSIDRTKIFLKAPITTPQGGGYKSLNVTVRKTLGLYANVRPNRSLSPYVRTKHPKMDVVIVRENEEDLYAGIEHRQTDDVYQCLKLVSRPGTERIVRYAFEYAVANSRKKVTCFSKDNIMKLTDGLFHSVYDEIGKDYPNIEKEHWIIDIGTARLADTPEEFDVIVTSNLYGDIISDVAAQIGGSVGMGGSANIGDQFAMFEAIHGSAPTIAGQGIANPSGLINGACMMLIHTGQPKVAEKIQNAWLKAIEDGVHTGDIYQEGLSKKKVGTEGFTEAVAERLGQTPTEFAPASYPAQKASKPKTAITKRVPLKKELVGVDVFICEIGMTSDELAEKVKTATQGVDAELEMITNRGVKVWPNGHPSTFCSDHWRCRFLGMGGKTIEPQVIWTLLEKCSTAGFDTIKTENLYEFDGEKGFSLAQGQ